MWSWTGLNRRCSAPCSELYLGYEAADRSSSSSLARTFYYTMDEIHSKIMDTEGGGVVQAHVIKIIKNILMINKYGDLVVVGKRKTEGKGGDTTNEYGINQSAVDLLAKWLKDTANVTPSLLQRG